MLSLIYGGSGCGKSAYAEERILQLALDKKIYIATMQIYGKEGMEKVKRHQDLRAGKGFETVECQKNLLSVDGDKSAAALLECMSNLVANEMFVGETVISSEQVISQIKEGILHLKESYQHLVIVSNNVFEDGIVYDNTTMEYMKTIGRLNAWIASIADEVVEVVVGIPLIHKEVK